MNYVLQGNDQIDNVLRTGKSVRINGTRGRKVEIIGGFLAKAVLYAPLVLGNESVGVLIAVRNNDDYGFTLEDESALRMLVKLCAIAVREYKSREVAEKAAQRELEGYAVYQKILQALLKQNDLVGIYSEARELIRARWTVENVGLWLVDDITNSLEPFPKPAFHKAYVFGEELIGTVATQTEPVLANDIKIFADTKNSIEPTLQLLARSAVCAPLLDGDKVLGVLAMFSAKENEFAEDDAKLFGVYSQAATDVIRKTLLFEQTKKQKSTILAAVNMLQHPIMIINQEGKLVMSNKAADAMIGELQAAISNGNTRSGGTTAPSLVSFLNDLSGSKSRTNEILVGDKIYVATLESAAMVGTIILLQDVTDPVTGVFSNHHYHVLAGQAFIQAKRYSKPLAVLVIGFEDFTEVLDEHGYAVGNRILKELAIRLRGYLRTPDILGRFHDDSFAIILPETELVNAKTTAERILHQLKESPIVVEKRKSMSKPAAGVALLNINKDTSIDDLIKKAGEAFSSATINKKSKIVVYES